MTAQILIGLALGIVLIAILARLSLKLTDEPLRDWPDCDCGVLPADFKAVHDATYSRGGQHDHA